jgi:multidrug resistance protein, MATE family
MGHVLRLAYPLILASSGHAFRLFADRVMLSRYGAEAIAASLPAGLTCFCFMSFFIGTAGYVNTFVAQYSGAGRADRAGAAVWQGLYIALVGGVVVAAAGLFAGPIFAWMGHPPAVQIEQARYFRVLCSFSFAGISLASLNAFWSGRGLTRVVMAVELISASMNILLNYVWIFGRLGFPELGILGAGLGTVVSNMVGLVLAFYLFLLRENRRSYRTWPRRTLDPALLLRLLRFGLPNGLQFMLSMLAFNLFVVFVGRLGWVQLESANIAFGLNALAFLPIIGLGMSASILVGQGIGAKDVSLAKRAVRSTVLLALLYNLLVGGAFLFLPQVILRLFVRPGDAGQVEVLRMATHALRYIAAYLLFDAVYVVYSHAVKGAGDTRFAMVAGVAMSWGTLVLPCYLAHRNEAGVWIYWQILVAHVVIAATVFYARYRTGKWQSMRVIEP